MLTCTKCNGTGYIKDSFNLSVVRCSCLESQQLQAKLFSLSMAANLPNYPEWNPSMYVGEKSKDNMRKLQLFVNKFEERFKTISMYWVGTNSTQKTTSAHWAACQLLLKGWKVQYVTMQHLIKDLLENESFSNTSEKVQKYYQADFLIIDESFDPTKVTVFKSQYQIPFLDSFLRERMEIRRRSTLFISNVSTEQIDSFSTSLRALVERCTAGSIFTFEDRYMKDVSVINNLWEG